MRRISNECLCAGQKSLFSNTFWLSIWILSCFGSNVIGTIILLSPMSVAPVCRVGDPLQLTCTASVEFLEWNMRVINEYGRLHEITAFSNSRDMNQQPTLVVVNGTSFTFMRISARNATPLVSILAINSTSIGLNGTVVRCMDANNPMTSASTTIHIGIINNHYVLTLWISSEEYSAANVTVTVEWNQLVGAMYYVRLVPLVPVVYTRDSRYQLTIPYNTEYNFSVESIIPCRPNTTAVIKLKYANCGQINAEMLLRRIDSVPNIEVYDGFPIEGSTVRFSCRPGLTLINPNSATCTESGEWELNSNSWPTCVESKGNLKTEDSNELVVAVSSTVIIFLVIAILTLVAGFASGYYFRGRKCNESCKKTQDCCTPSQPAAPLYEYVDTIPSAVEHQEQGLELKENVAYGPSKLDS